MYEIVHVYEKQRKEFGRFCGHFKDTECKNIVDIAPKPSERENYIIQNPRNVSIQSVPQKSNNEVNTGITKMQEKGMNHLEGGWPTDVDAENIESKTIYIRKRLQEDKYKNSVKSLFEPIDHFLKQNTALDIYENYFEDIENSDYISDPPKADPLTVLRDPAKIKRSASHISWFPTDGSKVAVALSNTDFSHHFNISENTSLESYIWDLNNPNKPESVILPASPLRCLEYNPKDTNLLVGGCYNGVVALYDVRTKDRCAVSKSDITATHKEAVNDVRWIQSKNSTLFLSTSTDGSVHLWDSRMVQKPQEVLQLIEKKEKEKPAIFNGLLGGVNIHYNATFSATKFMVGTEQGAVVTCTRRKNKPTLIDKTYFGHHGPVQSVARNPFVPRFFLSIGDWTAKIWNEELLSPIISTKYHEASLNGGAWSLGKPSTFFTIKGDGCVDVWDYIFNQNYPLHSLSVSDKPLRSIKVYNANTLAVGSDEGTITVLKLSKSLSETKIDKEKDIMHKLFERESKKEARLITQRKQLKLEGSTTTTKSKPSRIKIKEFDAKFENIIPQNNNDEDSDIKEDINVEPKAGQEEEDYDTSSSVMESGTDSDEEEIAKKDDSANKEASDLSNKSIPEPKDEPVISS